MDPKVYHRLMEDEKVEWAYTAAMTLERHKMGLDMETYMHAVLPSGLWVGFYLGNQTMMAITGQAQSKAMYEHMEEKDEAEKEEAKKPQLVKPGGQYL